MKDPAEQTGAYNVALFPELRPDHARHPMERMGILPSQHLETCISDGCIRAEVPIAPEQLQPASLDLRLGPVAYRVRASFLPGSRPVLEKVHDLVSHELDLTTPTVLERGCVYIVPLLERLDLPPHLWGKANPKSSVGRLDVFTRLITDYTEEFERVAPGYHGGLYLEVVPRTFSILVRAGTCMNQLRLIRGTPLSSDALLSALHERDTLVYGSDDAPTDPMISEGLWISVDLAGSDDQPIIGYRALPHAPLVDLDRVGAYDPSDFWEPLERPRRSHLILNPEDFYILASKQRIHVPTHAAAELVGYDPAVGEFRIHYAGFFDPGFGYETEDARGARAVLEVRSHEVPFVLEDNQRVGRFIYEALQAPPTRVYGPAIGSSYQSQGLSLSKQFKRWG